MKFVNVDKAELLAKLKTNRDLHVKDYEETMVGYKAKVLQRVTTIQQKISKDDFSDLLLGLHEPQSYESSYNKAISMLEMSTDTIISLSDVEFQQLVLDEWSWKPALTMMNAMYK